MTLSSWETHTSTTSESESPRVEPWSGVELLYRGNSMQPKIFKIDPPGLTTGLFDLRIGSGVSLLSAIASSTGSGVLCGPISGHFGTNRGRTFAEQTLGDKNK